MLKGGEREQEEEGEGEGLCVVTDLVFDTVPVHSCTWLRKAGEGYSLDVVKAFVCVTEGIKVVSGCFSLHSAVSLCVTSVSLCAGYGDGADDLSGDRVCQWRGNIW